MTTPDASSQTILIVEDDEQIVKALKSVFDFEKVNCLVATDGQQALDVLSNTIPSLILLDIMLPKILGLKVLEVIKSRPETMNIPVIVISNYDGYRSKALEMGADEFLLKVRVSIERIKEIIAKYLQKQ